MNSLQTKTRVEEIESKESLFRASPTHDMIKWLQYIKHDLNHENESFGYRKHKIWLFFIIFQCISKWEEKTNLLNEGSQSLRQRCCIGINKKSECMMTGWLSWCETHYQELLRTTQKLLRTLHRFHRTTKWSHRQQLKRNNILRKRK